MDAGQVIQLDGAQVRAVRQGLGISGAQAGHMAGLANPAAWYRWERLGISGPSALIVLLMARDPDAMHRLGLRATADG